VEPILLEPGPPWNYAVLVRRFAVGKTHALDLGTGGGEFLSRIRQSLPPNTTATEEWRVNAPIAQRQLRRLNVDTVSCRSLSLPFQSSTFDLVIDRHEELDPREIARVLMPGGLIVTQQVGDYWRELRRFFPRATDFSSLYQDYVQRFKGAGLRLLRNEQHFYKAAYPSLGEVVYLLTVAPWWLPGFSLERDLDALLSLESELLGPDGLVLTESHFLIVAEK
jgi:SAM-dependent methyltransferase